MSEAERSEQLARFGFDKARLEAALRQAAGYVKPHGMHPVLVQVRSQLGRISGEMLDRERRSQQAAKSSGPARKGRAEDFLAAAGIIQEGAQ